MNKIIGIDISYHQGTVDFNKIKAAGIKFVILREGYRLTMDKKFLEYVKGFQKVGIPILGVYHFSYALNVAESKKEAAMCIANMKAAGLGKDVMVFFDFEYDTIKQAKASGVTLTSKECNAHTKAFCQYVESQGYKAGIYSNIDYYKNMYDKDLINKYIFWLADYTGEPNYPCTFQQYTSSGKVNGIKGNVDMNYYFVEEESETKKTNEEVAEEVIAGKWGNGASRKANLVKAGYDYAEIQAVVNKLLKKKSVKEIAKEVLLGKWGNNPTRKEKLTEAGYNYSEVQKEVNKQLK